MKVNYYKTYTQSACITVQNSTQKLLAIMLYIPSTHIHMQTQAKTHFVMVSLQSSLFGRQYITDKVASIGYRIKINTMIKVAMPQQYLYYYCLGSYFSSSSFSS